MSLHNRILLLFLVLLLVVLGVTLVTVSQATYRHTLELAKEDLAQAREIVIDKLRSRQASLRESAGTLAKDDALRQTIFVDIEDRESVRLALNNHRQRTSADLSMLIELDGTIMVDTVLSARQESPFPFPELLSLDAAQASAIEVIELGGQLY